MKTTFALIAVAAFSIATSSALAQPQQGPPRGPGGPGGNPIMDALDPDHNQELSAEEIANATAVLKSLDTNGDGVLNDADLTQARGGRGGRRGGPGQDQQQRASDFASRLKAFDANGNGNVEKDELPERMQRVLDRLDNNGDGVLDSSELEAVNSNQAGRRGRADRRGGRGQAGDGGGAQRGQRGGGTRGQQGRRGEADSRGPGPGGRGGPGGGVDQMIDHAFQFDRDGDGKLSRDELAEFARNMPRPGGGGPDTGSRGRGGFGGPGGQAQEGRGGAESRGGQGGRGGQRGRQRGGGGRRGR